MGVVKYPHPREGKIPYATIKEIMDKYPHDTIQFFERDRLTPVRVIPPEKEEVK